MWSVARPRSAPEPRRVVSCRVVRALPRRASVAAPRERCRAARAFAHIVNICSTQRRAVFPGSRDSLPPLSACSAARDHEAGPATDHREGLMSTAASAGAGSVIDLALAEAGREHRRPFPSRPGAALAGLASRRGPSRRPPPTPPAVRPGWSASCSVPAHGRRSSLPVGQPAAGCGRRSSPTRSGTGSACQSTPKRRPAVRRSSRAAGPGCCRKSPQPDDAGHAVPGLERAMRPSLAGQRAYDQLYARQRPAGPGFRGAT